MLHNLNEIFRLEQTQYPFLYELYEGHIRTSLYLYCALRGEPL